MQNEVGRERERKGMERRDEKRIGGGGGRGQERVKQRGKDGEGECVSEVV